MNFSKWLLSQGLMKLEHADLAVDNANAMATLVCVLSKADIGSMCVAGQFNHRFIIACLHGVASKNLFIMDQQTADKKYYFQMLPVTTQLKLLQLFMCFCFYNCLRLVFDCDNGPACTYLS